MTDTPKIPTAIDHELVASLHRRQHYLDVLNALQAAHSSISQTFKALEVAQNNLSDCHDAYWQMRNNFEKDEKRRQRRSGWGDGPPALITLRVPTFNDSMEDLARKADWMKTNEQKNKD